MNWWQSSNSMVVISRMARNVCAPFFFEKKISHTGKSESHVIDGRCQQHTAPHTLCTRNIFSRVAPDRATGARLSPRLNVRQTVCTFARIVCRSRASCLARTHHCWIFHLFSHPHLFSASTIAVTINHRIHGQQDRLVVWSYKVRSQKPQGDTSTEFQPRSEHGLREADHRISRRNGRSHFVARLPALQLFPFG